MANNFSPSSAISLTEMCGFCRQNPVFINYKVCYYCLGYKSEKQATQGEKEKLLVTPETDEELEVWTRFYIATFKQGMRNFEASFDQFVATEAF